MSAQKVYRLRYFVFDTLAVLLAVAAIAAACYLVTCLVTHPAAYLLAFLCMVGLVVVAVAMATVGGRR